MRRAHRNFKSYAIALVAIALLPAASAPAVFGQASAPAERAHILLPPSYGATPLSTVIHAKASLVAATGDFLESAARARQIDSTTDKLRMENSVEWVRTYFQRKELHRQYTQRKNYLELQRDSDRLAKSLVTSDYQIELKTDPSDKLNIMLDELMFNALPQQFYPGGQDTLVDSKDDQKLSRDDIHHIWMTDGGRGKARLLFRADEVPLTTRWPRVLRAKKLETQRLEVEWARDAAIEELKGTGEVSEGTSRDLTDKVDALTLAFRAEYPRKRRLESMETYSTYLAGERFLQSFAISVFKMITAEDQPAFSGSYRFEGDSVADLVAHMHKFGLKFAPRKPGDEGVYQKLFATMRQIYLQVANDTSG